MSADPRAVLREALTLTEEERAELAAELLASLEDAGLEDSTVVSELWRREFERRARGVLTGADDGETWSDLRTRLTDQLTSG